MLVLRMMTHHHSNICNELRQARTSNCLTYLDVSNLSGLSISTIVNSERKIPSLRTVMCLSKVYKLKIDFTDYQKGNIVYL